MNTPTYLTDLVRIAGGWPINLNNVAELLAAADKHLTSGRDHTEALTEKEITKLGFRPIG